MTLFDLTGRKAVVTGAAGRIGAAIAQGLVAAGASVTGVDQAASDAGAYPVVQGDAGDPKAQAPLMDQLEAQGVDFTIWVNAAYPRTEDWGQAPGAEGAESWTENVTLQMTAACVASDAACQRIAQRGGGSVLNLSSIYGLRAPEFSLYEGTQMGVPGPYAAIKAGLVNHTRYLAARYGDQGVRVNVLAPGGVEAGQPEPFRSRYAKRTPLGRMADASDLAGPAVFLCSDAASYVTGVCLPVDGGWLAV